ncbi:MAG: prolipoprotein diacylglyceryl transferase [Clostridia bacterium]|nr:prolipoprotein diacylglyceryl transferase [Clostridia bacterium]
MFEIGLINLPGVWTALAAGAGLALLLGVFRSRKAGIGGGKIFAATLLLPLGVAFFAHLMHCLMDAAYVVESHSLGFLFAFWKPGYMFYGGILGAALVLLVLGGKQRLKLLEAYAPSAALMLAASRIAEGFAGQGYGEYWFEEEMFFCRFPFMTYDAYYEGWAWALFMAEALVAVILLVVLLARKKTWDGDGALLLLGLYAAAQIVLESLRRDEFLRWGFVRIEEVFSGVAVLLVLICYCLKAGKGRIGSKISCFVVFLLMAVLCLLLEFATEGRISFLLFLEVYQCYLVMAAACCVIAGCVLWMRHLCNTSKMLETNV